MMSCYHLRRSIQRTETAPEGSIEYEYRDAEYEYEYEYERKHEPADALNVSVHRN